MSTAADREAAREVIREAEQATDAARIELISALKAFQLAREDLRDRFAMAAMQGLLAHSGHSEWQPSALSADAYAVADAMIEARAPKGEAK